MRKLLAVALILIAGSLNQWTTSPVKAQDGDLFPDKEVQIINRTGVTVSFYLKNNKTDWVAFSLAPGANQLYKRTEQIYIRSTNGDVNYYLKRNKRYEIVWDNRRLRFDLHLLTKKG